VKSGEHFLGSEWVQDFGQAEVSWSQTSHLVNEVREKETPDCIFVEPTPKVVCYCTDNRTRVTIRQFLHISTRCRGLTSLTSPPHSCTPLPH